MLKRTCTRGASPERSMMDAGMKLRTRRQCYSLIRAPICPIRLANESSGGVTRRAVQCNPLIPAAEWVMENH